MCAKGPDLSAGSSHFYTSSPLLLCISASHRNTRQCPITSSPFPFLLFLFSFSINLVADAVLAPVPPTTHTNRQSYQGLLFGHSLPIKVCKSGILTRPTLALCSAAPAGPAGWHFVHTFCSVPAHADTLLTSPRFWLAGECLELQAGFFLRDTFQSA